MLRFNGFTLLLRLFVRFSEGIRETCWKMKERGEGKRKNNNDADDDNGWKETYAKSFFTFVLRHLMNKCINKEGEAHFSSFSESSPSSPRLVDGVYISLLIFCLIHWERSLVMIKLHTVNIFSAFN